MSMNSQSKHFSGTIGQTIAPTDFPSSNYIIDDSKYDYEGNWAFCRFNSEAILAARFGFGRGMLDLSDYGANIVPSKSYLWLHIELMTSEGAVLWLCTEKFKAEMVAIKKDSLDIEFVYGRHEIFSIHGWPQMKWHFESDDREVEISMEFNIRNVTILPDNIMPLNLFAMWLAFCDINGSIRINGKQIQVTGTAFYDHPRINVQYHEVPTFGWYLYTPMRFSDGSYLAAYYTETADGDAVDYYCFGLYIDNTGKSIWLEKTKITSIAFDDDNKPKSWVMQLDGREMEITIDACVTDTSISKIWGNPIVPKTRKENGNIPLVFDCEVKIAKNNVSNVVTGEGLAEYIRHARL